MADRRDNPEGAEATAPEGDQPADQERRAKTDRREIGRRASERRLAGIGEVIPERRSKDRRSDKRRTLSRRD